MIGRAALLVLLALPLLASCQSAPPLPPGRLVDRPAAEDWNIAILAADRDRLDRLGAAWSEGLAEARAQRFSAQVRALGPLLEPAAALPRAAPPPGSYRCRLVRLGAGPGRRAFTLFPSYFCHVGVEGALLSLTKQSGSERAGGYLFDDGDRRLVFLGAVARGAETLPPAYGADEQRHVVGVVERIGPFHYRMVAPWPRDGAKLDVLELVPVVPGAD